MNRKIDMIWIIPEIIGELFLTVYTPIRLLQELSGISMFSIQASEIKWWKNNENQL